MVSEKIRYHLFFVKLMNLATDTAQIKPGDPSHTFRVTQRLLCRNNFIPLL